jgi:hypothetical protein
MFICEVPVHVVLAEAERGLAMLRRSGRISRLTAERCQNKHRRRCSMTAWFTDLLMIKVLIFMLLM